MSPPSLHPARYSSNGIAEAQTTPHRRADEPETTPRSSAPAPAAARTVGMPVSINARSNYKLTSLLSRFLISGSMLTVRQTDLEVE